MNQRIVMLGAGGHAIVLLEAIKQAGQRYPEAAVIPDDHPAPVSFPLPIWRESDLDALSPAEILLINGLGSVENVQQRASVFLRFKQRGYHFASIIHPATTVAEDLTFGEGVQLMAGSVIQPGVTLEDNVLINTRCGVDHDCHIGKHTHVAPGVTLSGNVRIGDGCHIGSGATIIQGVDIAENVTVAAGACVVTNVAKDSRVAGVPARPL